MEAVCLNSGPAFDDCEEYEYEEDCSVVEHDNEVYEKDSKKESPHTTFGLKFGSSDEAYDFYNMYGKERGFGIRASNSWFRSKRKERWRLFEVELQHNHTVSPEIRWFYKSDKKMILASRKQQELTPVTEVHIIKLYRTSTDAACSGSQEVKEKDSRLPVDTTKHLELKEGDAHALYNYFCHMKLTNPNFFYLMDLDDEGCLRNVFWADARSTSLMQLQLIQQA
ncbi:hypothetical protein T459_17117 [Capsicum annuum]|uniref:Protein FAR1-RELATED SEQUENCE n=1 Tax=Capsicum annuum TaxID=4072 RepID=A0A2G2ZB18_CAPAN|nr:hypothetical protein T459_17117 [Capsicum annuum]